jgi:hypothetical protein
MSIYGDIVQKLGLRDRSDPSLILGLPPKPGEHETSQPAVPVVDVISKLEKLAAARPDKLDWKKSISDLLLLLGIDNSYEARKQLAGELGCPADKMGDSYQMNMWLHKTVLQKIADNGGNIPKELLD